VAALLAQLSGFDEHETELMRAASALHDIGKTRISDALLTKHGPLHGDEWIAMKAHTSHGHALLSTSRHAVHAMAAHIARDHHEHWDGQGYPQGLVGETITQVGRIAALADVLDSMTHSKCYGAAHSFEEAAQFIQAHSGSRFDPALVDIFRSNLAEFGKIYQN
jgi:HD-GYP domain-containing protein (c-di-GMP phosphodiesterase class II)